MSKPVVKKTMIEIEVGLNEDHLPESLRWRAEDNPDHNDYTECKAMSLAVFDKESEDTLKIDLWTTELHVEEMDRFIFQTLRSITDTYYKSTYNEKLANDMQNFVTYFGEQTGIITKK